jgi:NADH dehydrogenase FAD-containing subunit
LLASTTVGTLEFRCVAEPIHQAQKNLTYIQAEATSLDTASKTLVCVDHFTRKEFQYSYDKLVIATGAASATFNVPGVSEFALFLKELHDARKIRQKLIENFERACNPTLSDNERKKLLHVVVCGAGPTSIEFVGEFNDFIRRDVAKWFPDLADLCQITILEASQEILGSFDASLSSYTRKLFKSRDIEILTDSTGLPQ